jgi:hypothetical protein
MTELEARCLVERWVREYSPFKTKVVSLRPGQNGDWVVVVEYSTALDSQLVCDEKTAPFAKDERRH